MDVDDTEDSDSSSSDTSDSDPSEEESKSNKTSKNRKKKGKKIVSGRLEKVDEMDIVRPVKYPHAKLNSDFVRNKKFDTLPFHHLVAGELEIISSSRCTEMEKEARIGILKYLAYHFAYLDTADLREQYDAIMKQV